MVIGIAALVAATVSTISARLSLPPWSVQTEGRWTAYALQVGIYLVGELPLSLILLLAGVFLWPSRPRGLVAKVQGVVCLLIALVGLVVLAYTAYTWLGMELGPVWYVLWGILVEFGPMLAITILAAIAARKFLVSRA